MQSSKKSLTPIIGVLLAFAWSPVALAQYKCVVNGKTVYADAPCAANAKHVGELQDRLTSDQMEQREQVSRQESRQLGGIKAENEADRRQQQRLAEQVAAHNRAEENLKASRCSNARRDLQTAQRGVAIFRDVGMQNSLNQRAAEQAAAERRVRDECN